MNRMRRHAKKVVVLIASLAFGVALVYAGMQAQATVGSNTAVTNGATYRVVKVVDGDTAEIEINGQKKTVRFIGMDTPEVVDPRKTVQCFGREASARGHALLENQHVGLEYDDATGQVDKYGRLLAYIIMPDGSIYNQRMIADGYAHEYTYNNQSYKYQAVFKAAQANAQSQQLGFWSPNTCGGDTKQAAQ